MNELLMRRRLLMGKSAPNPYEGFTYGRIYNSQVRRSTTPINGKIAWVSPEYDVSSRAGHVLIYNYHTPAMLPKDFWSSDYAEGSMRLKLSDNSNWSGSKYNNWNGARNNKVTNTMTLPSNPSILVVATTYALADFYLYDKTAEEYIFRGLNVTPEYMVNSDAYRFVFDLPEEKTLKLFNNGTPSKVVIDGVNTTVATTYTLSEGKHIVYAWLNPWGYTNAYVGQPDGTSSTYLTEYRTPTWANTDVTTNAHYLYWIGTAPNLTEIISLCETPPNFGSGTNANKGLRASTLKTIKVPNNVVNLYKTTAPWNASAIVNKIVGTDFILN